MFQILNDSSYDPNLFSRLRTLRDQHGHQTRHRDDYLIPRYKRSGSRSHIHHLCVKCWNEIPKDISSLISLSEFKVTYRRILMASQTD